MLSPEGRLLCPGSINRQHIKHTVTLSKRIQILNRHDVFRHFNIDFLQITSLNAAVCRVHNNEAMHLFVVWCEDGETKDTFQCHTSRLQSSLFPQAVSLQFIISTQPWIIVLIV